MVASKILQDPKILKAISSFDDKDFRELKYKKLDDPLSPINEKAVEQIKLGIEALTLSGEVHRELTTTVDLHIRSKILSEDRADAKVRFLGTGIAIINEVTSFCEKSENKDIVAEM